jgi:hypothetical protein
MNHIDLLLTNKGRIEIVLFFLNFDYVKSETSIKFFQNTIVPMFYVLKKIIQTNELFSTILA